MPEMYIEPLTNRQECFNCQKTVTGKKKLWKCGGCQAITYCGQECQVEDRPRHKWNCVPVMVTEIEGKGRGLVAARDIEKGEVIFIDKPVIRLSKNWMSDTAASMLSLNSQIDALPIEAKKQWEKLNIPDDPKVDRACSGVAIASIARRFYVNARDVEGFACLYLNGILINHSCSPNATSGLKRLEQGKEGKRVEVMAIKDISKGEEITLCYPDPKQFKELGFSTMERMTGLFKEYRWHCKCCVCSGEVPDQEDIMKEMLELYKTVDLNDNRKTPPEWRKEAKTLDKIVDLTQKLYIGRFTDQKMQALITLARAAQLARYEELLEKALDSYNKQMEETPLEEYRLIYENWKVAQAKWTTELKGKKPPKKQEIDFFHPLKIKIKNW